MERSDSLEWLVWRLNEINRVILENRIWLGPGHAAIVAEQFEPTRNTLIFSLRCAVRQFNAGDIVDSLASAWAKESNAYRIAGVRVAVDDE